MNSTPYFQVGTGDDGPIVRSWLRERANWRTRRPVVFLNGCHSAALSPDDAYNYATGFLQTAHASAVVGTSIAVFERFAVEFAQEFLTRFITRREPLGAAMKGIAARTPGKDESPGPRVHLLRPP